MASGKPPAPPPRDSGGREAAERAEAERARANSEGERARAEYEAARAAAAAAAAAAKADQGVAHPAWKPPAGIAADPRFQSWSLCLDSRLRVGSTSTLTFALFADAKPPSEACDGEGKAGQLETRAGNLAVELLAPGPQVGLAAAPVEATNAGSRFRWTLEPTAPGFVNLRVQFGFESKDGEMVDYATLDSVQILAVGDAAPKLTAASAERDAPAADGPLGLWQLVTAAGAALGGLVTILSNLEKIGDMWARRILPLLGRRKSMGPV